MPPVVHADGSEVPTTRSDRQYIYADTFCGAGGASRGAVLAGLKLAFGVDHWPLACATWRRNFPFARMYEQDMFDFIHNYPDFLTHPVDILHLSPPCQIWSPLAYSHGGRMNEDNMAILFACPELINKIRPRLFTLEQTFGLLHDGHEAFLNALIQGFTRHGYSVRWKIIPLVEYGLPQTRKRLIMMGACPGEPLPPWPPATHAQMPTGSQKPYVTEARALRGLDNRRVTLHDVASAIVRNNPPRNGNVPFSKTITGKGAQGASHFSGSRDYTVREIACLQGFPVSHQFEGAKTAIKQQIGNAFPSCVAKAFYDHLRAWLQHVDGVQRAPAQPEARRFPVPRPAGPLVGRPQGLRNRVNGDLNEDEALLLALQESKRAVRSAAIIELSDDEDHSHVSTVGPMLERMSLAPSDHRAAAPPEPGSRSRSVTLDWSPGPSPGPSRRSKEASQKRSLDSMHDGEADEVMKEGSPPKRERSSDTRDDNKLGIVDDGKIPSGLSRYAGSQGPYDADSEAVAVGQSDRINRDSVELGDSHTSSSIRQDRAHHGNVVVEDLMLSESEWLTTLSPFSGAGASSEEVWTF